MNTNKPRASQETAASDKRKRAAKKNSFKHRVLPRTGHERFLMLSDALAFPVENAGYRFYLAVCKLEDGNTAGCKVFTGCETHTINAFSKGAQRLPDVRNAAFPGLTNEQAHHWRWNDTEFQILNYLHASANLAQGDQFAVRLYTERAPCPSCSVVISQFLAHYPHARIDVHYTQDDKVGIRASWNAPDIKGRISISRTVGTAGTSVSGKGKA